METLDMADPLLGDHAYTRVIVVAGSDRKVTKLPAESRESKRCSCRSDAVVEDLDMEGPSSGLGGTPMTMRWEDGDWDLLRWRALEGAYMGA